MVKRTPNILYILTDQQRKDTLNCYGGVICKTPNIDLLAKESTVFNNAYTTSPICTPARASMQTGLYPMHHGMMTNTYSYGSMVQELPDSEELLSRKLQKSGYSVGYTGKWHLGNGKNELKNEPGFLEYMSTINYSETRHDDYSVPTRLGFEGDDFPGHGYGGHQSDLFQDYLDENNLNYDIDNIITGNYDVHEAGTVTSPIESTVEYFLAERTIKYIEKFNKRDTPWFFQLNFWGPHEPYYAPEEFIRMYNDIDIPPWENFYEHSNNKPKIHDVKRANSNKWEDFKPYVKHYYASMSSIDAQIGRVIKYLKDNKIYDDTIIIFSSDHGESLGIHGGLSDKAIFMYEETCNIPLLIKMNKDINDQDFEDRFVNTCDIYSTILELSGHSRSSIERDGKSLVPLLTKQDVSWRNTVVTECSGIDSVLFTQRMIRKDKWKYVFNCGDIDELYNLEDDPYEKSNLINNKNYKSTLKDMRIELKNWMLNNKDKLIKQYQLLRKI